MKVLCFQFPFGELKSRILFPNQLRFLYFTLTVQEDDIATRLAKLELKKDAFLAKGDHVNGLVGSIRDKIGSVRDILGDIKHPGKINVRALTAF